MTRDERDRGAANEREPASSAVTGRRSVVRLFAGATLIPFSGCSGSSSSSPAGPRGGASASAQSTAPQRTCPQIPEETTGPFPADGSDGINVLGLEGIVRRDIRSSIGPGTAVADGVGLTVSFDLLDTNARCAPLAGYAVYVWHSDREGRYSMYSDPIENETYLRGVQAADADGRVTFTTIFPAAYSPRWPHIHFEIYRSVEAATTFRNKLVTSQLALPKDICEAVYATPGYEASKRNLAQVSLGSDIAFHDGVELQLPAMTGNVTDGYTATIAVGIGT